MAGSPGVTDTQLAAIGRSSLAATWASSSLPRSVPGAITADGERCSISSTSVCAQAAGAYGAAPSIATASDVLAHPARERERLLRELVGRVLDQRKPHQTTPISCSTRTTAGAASGPVPSTSASLLAVCGSTRRTISSRLSARAGSLLTSGLRLARRRPGTDG